MMTYIVIAIVAIVAVFLLIAAMQPADFRVERSATIAAPSGVVFPHVNELPRWEAWSPWAKMDPNAKMTYSGPASGVGASYAWAGNNQVGEGRMTIFENRPNEMIRIKLEFLKPFKATNTAEFTFKPEGEQTIVTWGMSGRKNFVMKAMVLIMGCDKMIGSQFEKGLADLGKVATAAKQEQTA